MQFFFCTNLLIKFVAWVPAVAVPVLGWRVVCVDDTCTGKLAYHCRAGHCPMQSPAHPAATAPTAVASASTAATMVATAVWSQAPAQQPPEPGAALGLQWGSAVTHGRTGRQAPLSFVTVTIGDTVV